MFFTLKRYEILEILLRRNIKPIQDRLLHQFKNFEYNQESALKIKIFVKQLKRRNMYMEFVKLFYDYFHD